MMNIHKVLLYVCMLVFTLPAWAQQPSAKEVLDRTAETFRKAGGVKIAFTVQAPAGSSSGTIRLKGEKFLLETDGVTTWFDGHTQWSYLASGDEVNVSNPTAEELQSINPYALLSLYRQGYNLQLEKADGSRSNSTYQVVLTATGQQLEFQRITLHVTKDTYRPERISTVQRGGSTATIIVHSYQTGENYPDALFVFDKRAYPTAEVIDLR